jgi:hypothetical protein
MTMKRFAIVIGVACWAFLLWRSLDAFGPGSDINNVSFNSDSAIPVLMANDDGRITVFNCYYYGADRWGAWPFLVAQLARRATGHRWGPESLTAFLIVWVFVGAWAMAVLGRDEPWIAGGVYLLVVCLHHESRYLLFELSQIYPWQITALLLSWACLRRFFESFHCALEHSGIRSAVWLLAVLSLSFLATWSSVASTVFLLFLAAVEILRARSKSRAPWISRQLLTPGLLGVVAIAAASLFERLLKASYRRYSLQHYGDSFATVFGVDMGHLADNFAQHWQHLARLSWWPLYVLPAVAMLALALWASYSRMIRKEAPHDRLSAVFSDDTVILAIGTYGVAALNFALTVLVDHVRLNSYDDRYLTVTNLFAPVSGLLTLFLLVRQAVWSSRVRTPVRVALAMAATGLLMAAFPAARMSPDYPLLESAAAELAQRAPRGVLMGSYWDTYVFIAFQPHDAMTPVPFEGDGFRTPWTTRALRRANEIVVAYARAAGSVETSLPRTLEQYGQRFTLADPFWYGNDLYVFARYVTERAER